MDTILQSYSLYPFQHSTKILTLTNPSTNRTTLIKAQSKNPHLRYPRRTKLPPDLEVNTFLKKPNTKTTPLIDDPNSNETHDSIEANLDLDGETDDVVWDPDEIEAISSLFRGRIPQKPGKLNRVRPLPLPLPHKIRPIALPTPKKHKRAQSLTKLLYKNPSFLIGLAKEIKNLPQDEDVSRVLKKWVQFLRKGSLSITIKELGHMGLAERALQVFSWAQKQPLLFPDDRILASTVEVLAMTHELKMPFNLESFVKLGSRSVNEAMMRGYIRGGNLKLALKLLRAVKYSNRVLGSGIYAKLILELAKNPDRYTLVLDLLQELGEREHLNLSQQDCTSIMKVCVRLGKFETVEVLFNWFKQKGRDPSVVMYTMVIHSRYSAGKYREALALVWEMEGSNCALDFPAYRVLIKLFVALNDFSRTVRYFAKLKEAGFSPTFDIYRDLVKICVVSGRMAKCKEVCKEAEMAGFKFDKQTRSWLLQLEG
ncbi:hypothetical protein LguiB_021445 [Lonicera macranthoides]